MSSSDRLPKQICATCIGMINKTFTFRKKCLNVDILLKNVISSEQQEHLSNCSSECSEHSQESELGPLPDPQSDLDLNLELGAAAESLQNLNVSSQVNTVPETVTKRKPSNSKVVNRPAQVSTRSATNTEHTQITLNPDQPVSEYVSFTGPPLHYFKSSEEIEYNEPDSTAQEDPLKIELDCKQSAWEEQYGRRAQVRNTDEENLNSVQHTWSDIFLPGHHSQNKINDHGPQLDLSKQQLLTDTTTLQNANSGTILVVNRSESPIRNVSRDLPPRPKSLYSSCPPLFFQDSGQNDFEDIDDTPQVDPLNMDIASKLNGYEFKRDPDNSNPIQDQPMPVCIEPISIKVERGIFTDNLPREGSSCPLDSTQVVINSRKKQSNQTSSGNYLHSPSSFVREASMVKMENNGNLPLPNETPRVKSLYQHLSPVHNFVSSREAPYGIGKENIEDNVGMGIATSNEPLHRVYGQNNETAVDNIKIKEEPTNQNEDCMRETCAVPVEIEPREEFSILKVKLLSGINVTQNKTIEKAPTSIQTCRSTRGNNLDLSTSNQGFLAGNPLLSSLNTWKGRNRSVVKRTLHCNSKDLSEPTSNRIRNGPKSISVFDNELLACIDHYNMNSESTKVTLGVADFNCPACVPKLWWHGGTCKGCGLVLNFDDQAQHHTCSNIVRSKSQETKVHKCNICSEILLSKKALENHLNDHDIGIVREMLCCFCEVKCDSKRLLQLHIRSQHGNKLMLMCDLCNAPHKTVRNLITHMHELHDMVEYDEKNDSERSKHTSGQFLLKFNSIKNNPGTTTAFEVTSPIFKCMVCTEMFITHRELMAHLSALTQYKHHNDSHSDCVKMNKRCELRHVCSFCNTIFDSKLLLSRHISLNHMGPYKCVMCTNHFGNKYSLEYHTLTNHNNEIFKCRICERVSSSIEDLSNHLEKHKDEFKKPSFKCDMCPKTCRKRFQLVNHMRTHTGETPYKCLYCPRQFSLYTNRSMHMRLHSGEKRYVCNCGKAFTHNVSRKNHVKQHSKEVEKVALRKVKNVRNNKKKSGQGNELKTEENTRKKSLRSATKVQNERKTRTRK